MVELIGHGDVTEWRFSTRVSRMFGFRASAFLTADGVLIDTGIPAAERAFDRLLDEHDVRAVVLTHHHEDHAGNAERVARRGLPMWIAPATAPLIASVAPIGIHRRVTWHSMPPLRTPIAPFELTQLVAIPTPGHSADHHAIWDPRSRTLFSGDLFLGVAVRVAHRGEHFADTIDSLEHVAALEPARMFCAHRSTVEQPAAALRAKAIWLRETIDAVRAEISRGATDEQILRRVLGGESLTGWMSAGEYSRRNFVHLVRTSLADRRKDS